MLTIKGGGMVMRKYELALSRAQFEGLRPKCTGRIISKNDTVALPDGLVAEVDVFAGEQRGLILAEVEFPDRQRVCCVSEASWFEKMYHRIYDIITVICL